MQLVTLGILGVLFAGAVARADDLVAGPLLGHTSEKSARVWLQLSVAKTVTVSAFDTDGGRVPVSQVAIDVEGPTPFVADVPVNTLDPNKTYRVEIKLDDKVLDQGALSALSIRTMPPPGEESPFTVAAGSGMEPHGAGTAPIFSQIRAASPRAFFFLGDSGKLPEKVEQFPEARRAAFRFISDFHARIRREPDLQALFRSTPIYAIWGERDFGSAGADRNFVFARESLAAFQRFYPNPDWGTPQVPGCFFSMTIGDADFFCLDERSYRDPAPAAGAAETPRSLLGVGQLEWLKSGLQRSTARFKIIAGSVPFLAASGPEGAWPQFQPEQADFVRWLFANHISGVLLVSGGGAVGELTVRKPQAAGEYPLLDLTTAHLTDRPAAGAVANAERIGDAVTDNHFATLEFGGAHANRFVTLRLKDGTGKTRVEQTIGADQLK